MHFRLLLFVICNYPSNYKYQFHASLVTINAFANMAPKSLVKLIMEMVRIHNRSRPSSAGTEPALSKSGGSEPTGSEINVSPNSRLNMPVEVILKLTDFLPHRDRALLSLTCTGMRAAVNFHPDSHATDSRERCIEYLFCLARDLPRC